MIAAYLATAGTSSAGNLSDPATYVPSFLSGTGAAGFWLLAFLKNWIVTAASHNEVCKSRDSAVKERDEWKNLYLKETEAHQRTREAFMTASQRADVAIDSGRMVVSVMEALRSTTAAQSDGRLPSPQAPAPGAGSAAPGIPGG